MLFARFHDMQEVGQVFSYGIPSLTERMWQHNTVCMYIMLITPHSPGLTCGVDLERSL